MGEGKMLASGNGVMEGRRGEMPAYYRMVCSKVFDGIRCLKVSRVAGGKVNINFTFDSPKGQNNKQINLGTS